ncbi:MAG: galactokinase [Treponema sp.]|nr:galactokinase [Treponema sp.]
MIDSRGFRIFSAPGRTELAGNHTDHNNGKVLAAAIQLHIKAQAQKTDDNTVYFFSAGFPDVKVKLTDNNGKYDLQIKPKETGITDALIRGIAAEFNKRGYSIGGFSANTESGVLPGSGLSSSAAVETLIVRIFDSLYGEGKMSAIEIAQISQIAENMYFGKPCGLMDQIACAAGGAASIDFANAAYPNIKNINFDPAQAGYSLCIVNTGGSHADLTADYASIPAEMKSAAALFGKSVLRELDKETVISRAADIRKKLGDRALLRAIHFFDENARVESMTSLLIEMENASSGAEKQSLFTKYLDLVNESGNSSCELLQNIFSLNNPKSQGIAAALAFTKDFLQKRKLKGAYRVHGGGFAGTIQAYIPMEAMNAYRSFMEAVFGGKTVTELRIRHEGAIEIK